MGKLEGRVAIVTGAAQGIGKAIADKLAAEGASVVVADVNGAGGRGGRAGGRHRACTWTSPRRPTSSGWWPTPSPTTAGSTSLVNNAAIVPFVAWDDLDFAEWRRIMAVNLDGTFLCCHHGHRPMRDAGYGRIVNISSNVVLAGTPNLAHYVASKGGILGVHPRAWPARSASTGSP